MTKHGTTRVQAWLHEVPLFEGCSDDELTWIDGLLTEITVPAGHQLTRQGSLGQEFVLVGDGWAGVDRDGDQIAVAGPGSLVGELALVDRAPRAATVTATTDMRVLIGSVREFNQLLDVPGVAARVKELAAAHREGEASAFDAPTVPMARPGAVKRWGGKRSRRRAALRTAW